MLILCSCFFTHHSSFLCCAPEDWAVRLALGPSPVYNAAAFINTMKIHSGETKASLCHSSAHWFYISSPLSQLLCINSQSIFARTLLLLIQNRTLRLNMKHSTLSNCYTLRSNLCLSTHCPFSSRCFRCVFTVSYLCIYKSLPTSLPVIHLMPSVYSTSLQGSGVLSHRSTFVRFGF